jgi:hypothetical protein
MIEMAKANSTIAAASAVTSGPGERPECAEDSAHYSLSNVRKMIGNL